MVATATEPTRAERIDRLSAAIAPLEEKRDRLRVQREEAAEILARMQERLLEGKLSPEKLTDAQGKLGVLDHALQKVSDQMAPLVAERDALQVADRAAAEREATLQALVDIAERAERHHAELLAARTFMLNAIRKGRQRYGAARTALEQSRREFARAADNVQRGVVDRRSSTSAEDEAAFALLEALEERTDMTGIYAASSLTPGMTMQRDRSAPSLESLKGLKDEDKAILRAILPQ